MASGRRKPHHTHETHDAFAEGWDARLRWRKGDPIPVNPYGLVTEVQLRKQSGPRRAVQQRDQNDWDLGWRECASDKDRGDLAEITDRDFRNAPTVGVEPTTTIFDAVDEDDF